MRKVYLENVVTEAINSVKESGLVVSFYDELYSILSKEVFKNDFMLYLLDFSVGITVFDFVKILDFISLVNYDIDFLGLVRTLSFTGKTPKRNNALKRLFNFIRLKLLKFDSSVSMLYNYRIANKKLF